jgi:dGTP triphosphohydrolase
MFKRKRSMYQRIKILIRALLRHRNLQKHSCQWQLSKKKIVQYLQRLFNRQKPFCDSITICYEFTEDRKKHMTAIEHSRNKKIFDNLNEYQTYAIEHQGKYEYENLISEIKQTVFENTNMTPREMEIQATSSKYVYLENQLSAWDEGNNLLHPKDIEDLKDDLVEKWLEFCSKAR